MNSFRLILFATMASATLMLSGCGGSSESEVRQWMAQTKQQTRPYVHKVDAPKKFTPFTYTQQESVAPFNPEKLEVAFAKLRKRSKSGIKPDLKRRREPLEQVPLDTIKMVGSLRQQDKSYAVLQVDKMVYRAKVGNYLGQNFGKITNIKEDAVHIREIVQDASGEWTERKAKLELQEITQ